MNPLKDVPLYLLLFHSLAALAAEVNPEEMFRFPSRTNNIAVSASGKVFVATENFLYQLNQRLGLEVRERTGPLLEGPCTEKLGCCAKWKETANVNKILVVDDKKQRVLTCGTVSHGTCNVRELHNISRYQNDSLRNVASLHPEASTIAFLVNGTMRTYLVTAITPTGKSSRFIPDTCKGNRTYYEGFGATISLRNPEGGVGDSTFLGFNDGAYGDAVVDLQDNHPVELQYVQGFQWQSHIYILLNANTSGPEIIRMDIKDRGTSTLQSFAQATLFCPWGEGQAIRVLSSALIHPSHSPAFMAAILSQQGHPENTALYFYSLTQFNGYPECHKDYFKIKNKKVCNNVLRPINSISIFTHPGLLSVSARIVRDWIVLFLGTDDGQLIKLVIDRNMTLIRPTVLFELKEETPIHHRVMFDKLDSNHLYITSETEVRRLKVATCAQYSSCTGCLFALDPYCGWCTLKKRCSFENECENSNHTVHWITMAEQHNSCPRVTFKPSAIDYSLNNTKLFKIEVTGKLRTLIKENATCMMRKARNKEVICTGKYTNANDCPCRLTNNIYTQLENEPDPIIIEASVEFNSLKFSTRVTVHNCYKIATVRFNNVP